MARDQLIFTRHNIRKRPVQKIFFSQLVLFLLLALSPAMGAKPAKAAVDPATLPLDIDAVRSYYNDGDFGPAIDILEEFQRTHSNFTREESLSVYKYLGVMYCADLVTREKGKSYFYKLLKIEPEARILDMYVSIVVQDIFKSTLDELMNLAGKSQPQGTGEYLAPPPAGGSSDRRPQGAPPRTAGVGERKSHTGYWLIGGLAVAAVAAGGYYAWSASSEEAPDEIINVNPDN